MEVQLPAGAAPVGGPRRRAVLAALLLRPRRMVSKDKLLDAVWDGEPPSSATANLRTYVSELRKSLGSHPSGQPVLISMDSGYLLDVGPSQLDMLQFEELAEHGTSAVRRGDVAGGERLLGTAVNLWRGEPFDGVELADWARAKVTALSDDRWGVLTAWVDARLTLNQTDGLVSLLRDMVAERPLCERTWAQLMVALHRSGRTAEALQTFARARTVLTEQLGLEPGSELVAVQGDILAGDRPATGETRAPAHTVSHMLPAAIPDHVGRETELRTAADLIRGTGACGAMIEVVGQPGAGKTALCLRVANDARRSFPDGQLYHSFAAESGSAPSAASVLDEFLRALGVAAADLPSSVSGRSALYRRLLAGRRMMIVLDDVTTEAQVRPLLPGVGACRTLVSGRNQLIGIEGFRTIRLGPLAHSEAVQLLRRAAGARRLVAEPLAAAAILGACAGLPLALRVVCARLAMRPTWPLVALADRLSRPFDRLDELVFGELDVRARFRRAYESLPPDVARAFRLAGTGGDTVTTASLATLLGDSEAAADRAIDALLRAGLLAQAGSTGSGEPCFRLVGLLRLYAAELGRAHERTEVPAPAGGRELLAIASSALTIDNLMEKTVD